MWRSVRDTVVVRYLPTPPAFDVDQRVAAKQIEIVSLQSWQTDSESNVVYRMAPPPFQ